MSQTTPPTSAPSPRRRVWGSLVLVAGLAVACAAGSWWWAGQRFAAHGSSAETIRLRIPKGSGLNAITAALKEQGLLPGPLDPVVFRLMVVQKQLASRLHAGEYDVPPGAGMDDLASMLVSGKNLVQYPLTIPEGLTTPEVLALLQQMEPLEGDLPSGVKTGELLPETYAVLRGDPREATLERMRQAMRHTVDELWEKRAANLPLETREQAVILASIVEKETSLASERPLVAAVFLNRLRQKMPLQSDPTVIYGLAPETGSLGRALTRADLEKDHPWNTYTRSGLPPSPIANPGKASLQAVLHPASSNHLYFVADGSGGHAFSATLVDHNRNVNQWRRLQKENQAAVNGK